MKLCEWKFNDQNSSWGTTCNMDICFENEDETLDEDMIYCHKCGKKIEQLNLRDMLESGFEDYGTGP